jgi:hypothetical protein
MASISGSMMVLVYIDIYQWLLYTLEYRINQLTSFSQLDQDDFVEPQEKLSWSPTSQTGLQINLRGFSIELN